MSTNLTHLAATVHSHKCLHCNDVFGPCSCEDSPYYKLCPQCVVGYVLKVTGPGLDPTRTYENDAGLDLYTYIDPQVGATQHSLNVETGHGVWYFSYKKEDGRCIPENLDYVAYQIPPRHFVDIDLGINVEIPNNYWIAIIGRSGTLRKRHLMVPGNVIDAGYRGRLYCPVFNFGENIEYIRHGERLGQLVIMPNCTAHFQVQRVEALADSQRGTNGFGSSGV